MKNGSDYGIYKMKTSGEDKRLIVKAFGSMQIVGNYIYYADYMYNGVYDDASGDDSCYHLYRCDLDGRNITEIICTSRRFTSPRRYLAPCSVEPGLSSLLCVCVNTTIRQRLPDQLEAHYIIIINTDIS